MIIYIAGKINGDPNYKEKFERAEKIIRKMGENYVVLSPAILPQGMEYKDYMRICFSMIDCAGYVFFLPDYIESEGARLEMSYCNYIKKTYDIFRL